MRYKCRACLYEFESNEDNPYCPSCENEGLNIVEEGLVCTSDEIDDHHIHPKFMNNVNGGGKKYPMTKKRHSILHGLIMKWLWEEIREEDKDKVINNIIKKSEEFLGVIE